jgi:hypothetical protein
MGEVAGAKTDPRWLYGSWRQPGVAQGLVFTLAEVIDALLKLVDKRASLDVVCTVEVPSDDEPCDCYLAELSELLSLEGIVELRCAISSLLAAIACEGMLNQFCFFNFGEELSESIEKLQPTEKLVIASSVLGHENAKADHLYGLLKNLSSWRNRFAHCHNPDTPSNSLTRNHVTISDNMKTFEDLFSEFPKHLRAYTELASWLTEKSHHHIVKFSNQTESSAALHFQEEFACFRLIRPRPAHIYEFQLDRQNLESLIKKRAK